MSLSRGGFLGDCKYFCVNRRVPVDIEKHQLRHLAKYLARQLEEGLYH